MPVDMKLLTKSLDGTRRPLLLAGFFILVLLLLAVLPCAVLAETSGEVEETTEALESSEFPEALADLDDAGILLGRDAFKYQSH